MGENNLHSRDIQSDQVENERRLNRIDHERFAEPMRRGYDIVTHDAFVGRKSKPPYLPYPCPQPDVWERVKRNRSVPSDFGRKETVTVFAQDPDRRSERSDKLDRAQDIRSERSGRSGREDARSERSRRSGRDGASERSRTSYLERTRSESHLPSGRRSHRNAPKVPALTIPNGGVPAVGYAPAAG